MDNHLIYLYFLWRNPLVRTIRILVFCVLLLALIPEILAGVRPNITLFLLNVCLMLEIFYRYRLSTMQSRETISGEEDDPYHVMTLDSLSALHRAPGTAAVIKRLLTYPQVNFFLERMGITSQELTYREVGLDSLTKMALKLAAKVGGKRITTMDLFAAYLLLSEDQSKLLFRKKHKDEDIVQILRWSRLVHHYEENRKTLNVARYGAGVGEFLVTGWTLETKKYTSDFTQSVEVNNVSIIGREKEYQELLESLLKLENNNVLLIGEVGVGKEQLVRKFALDSYFGHLDHRLRNKTVLELMVGSLLAGANVQGELQERLQLIVEEVSHAQNVILYIPEFQNLIGAGSFSLDLSGALVPYLKKGNLPIIVSMTESNYKTYMEQNTLRELFNPVILREPDKSLSELMVMEKTQELEKKASSIISYRALKAAVEFGDRYAQNEQLPGSAIQVLTDALSSLTIGNKYGKTKKKLLTEDHILQKIQERTKILLSEPTQDEKNILLHLEEILHRQIVGQDEALRTISEAMRRIRSGMESLDRPISFLFLGPTGVGKTETAKALARVYFGGEDSMIRLDMSEYSNESDQVRLLGSLPGQGEERGELTEKVRDHPSALILLDEFEKAHPSILNLFLQVLEDGRLTDNKGRSVSFVNTMIIATSNAGSDFVHERVEQGGRVDHMFEKELLHYLQHKNIFKPELLNRFDGIVTFTPLTKEEVKQVATFLLQDLIEQLAEKDIKAEISDSVLSMIATEAYDRDFGARPIRRYIQDTLQDVISRGLLSGEIQRGDVIVIDATSPGEFRIQKKNPGSFLDKTSVAS